MKAHLNPRRGCRGAATVEFAIVGPVLVLMLLMVGELGRAFYQYNTLTKAVREGARYAAGQAPGTLNVMVLTQGLRDRVANLVVYGEPGGGSTPLIPGLSTSAVTVTPMTSVLGWSSVRVFADFQFTPAAIQALPGFSYGQDTPLNFTLRASSSNRLL